MPDSEKDYPLRSSRRNEEQHQFDEDDLEERPRRRAPAVFYEDEDRPLPPLSPKRLPFSLLIGAIAGVVIVLVNIGFTFLNAPTFQREVLEGKNITYNTALAVAGLQCLSFIITLVFYAIMGFMIGRLFIQRRMAFYAGALAGAIVYATSFLTAYIPNYPGSQSTSSTPVPTGNGATTLTAILLEILFFFLSALIGGLISLLGAWIATRRNPYYLRQS